MTENLAQWARAQMKNKADPTGRSGGVTGKTRGDEIELVVQAVAALEPGDAGEGAVLGRLADLGVAAGETIRYFGRAPLGEPIFICVRETVIALRLNEAAMIFVERR